MASLELLPDGDSGTPQWTPTNTSLDNYEMVDEASHSDDTDYVSTTIGSQRDIYTFTYNSTLTDTTINSVTIHLRAMKLFGGGLKPFFYDGSYNYGTSLSLSTLFTNYSYTWSVNPGDSNAWEADSSGTNDIIDGRWGIQSVIPRGRGVGALVSAVWVVVDYTAAAVGYGNDVIGIDSGDISKVNGIATADIEKVNGV
jgi:hypothetical protein